MARASCILTCLVSVYLLLFVTLFGDCERASVLVTWLVEGRALKWVVDRISTSNYK